MVNWYKNLYVWDTAKKKQKIYHKFVTSSWASVLKKKKKKMQNIFL